MNNDEKTLYLNEGLKLRSYLPNAMPEEEMASHFSKLPKALFKYRKFDQWTDEMLSEEYLFLTPAKILDDPFECDADFSLSDLYDKSSQAAKRELIRDIIDYVCKYADPSQKKEMEQITYRCMNADFTMNRRLLLDEIVSHRSELGEVAAVDAVNYLGSIPEKMQSPEISKRMEALFDFAYNAKDRTGICSLAERPTNVRMWREYASELTGYCVEYDFEHDYQLSFDTFPVIYDDNQKST